MLFNKPVTAYETGGVKVIRSCESTEESVLYNPLVNLISPTEELVSVNVEEDNNVPPSLEITEVPASEIPTGNPVVILTPTPIPTDNSTDNPTENPTETPNGDNPEDDGKDCPHGNNINSQGHETCSGSNPDTNSGHENTTEHGGNNNGKKNKK
ncbi:MAG TPA: hypothetical protein VJ583_03495 [Nitrososphaeraceae archaeon]|nr:hypothetical protein [Nitrososphaeraceae archaeon]